MFVFVLTDKDGRNVFKFRAESVFQFNMTDDYTLSVSNYKEPSTDKTDVSKGSNTRAGTRIPSGEAKDP